MKLKKYRILLTIVVTAILCLCTILFIKEPFIQGADNRDESVIEDNTVGFLLSSDEENPQNELDGTYTLWKGIWDLGAGNITYDTIPVITMGGPNRQSNILSWDGEDQYIIWDTTYILQQDDSAIFVPYLEAYEDGVQVIWGPGYQVKLSSESQCTVVQEGVAPVVFESIDYSFTIGNDTVGINNLRFLGCDLKDDQLVLVYAYPYNQGESGVMLYATLDLATLNVNWSKMIQVPNEYCRGLFFCYLPYYPILDQKMYFSTGETIAYLDLNRNKIIVLESIPFQVVKLFPAVERARFNGRDFPAELVGRTNDVVVCSISCLEPDSDSSHEVYFAIKGDRIVGILDENKKNGQSTITVYNGNFERTAQVELPFVNTALQLEMVVSPWP